MPLTRRGFLSAAVAAQTAARRPNVLFIAVDDLDCRIPAYGDRVAKTPNIDRLARRAVRFDHAYCQFPLCNPTRSAVLSGRYPTTTGVLDNNTWLTLEPGAATLPEYFRRHGYNVATHGKIWHGPNRGFAPAEATPGNPGWFTAAQRAEQQKLSPAHWDESYSPYRNLALLNAAQYAAANRIGPLPGGARGQDAPIADDAIGSLRTFAAEGKPFFLATGFHKPHVPLVAPQKFFDMYDPAAMPLPADFDTEPRHLPGFPRDEFRQNIDLFAGRSFTVQEAREAMRAYYACISYMDEQLGRVLDALAESGQEKNTLIVFWGDHGWHLSEKGMWAKGTLFEVSARGPLFISDPRIRIDGRASSRTVQYIDMYPTLVDLCGLPAAPWCEGTSLRPLLENPEAAWNRPAHTVAVRNWAIGRSIRTERWRYTEWDHGKRGVALFDHDKDPHEMRNLAEDPAHKDTVATMKATLAKSPIVKR
ncbi:MAG: sulfatase [Acidobacteria bacterium]|nr:sulfatase [Acidobacteriota bacterium]